MNSKQFKVIKNQFYHNLGAKFEAGKNRSKHKDKQDGKNFKYIYSKSTYENYKKEAVKFLKWVKQNKAEVGTYADCEKCVIDYLEAMRDAGHSAYSLAKYKAALCKLFKKESDFYKVDLPKRETSKITRSRLPAVRDTRLSKEKHDLYASFVSCTGLRRKELKHLTGDCLTIDEKGNAWLNITEGTKGGKPRKALIYSPDEKELKNTIEIIQRAGSGRVFGGYVPDAFDCHHYRGDYAKRIYNKEKKDIKTLQGKEKITFRSGELVGKTFDRAALLTASRYLGHNRIDFMKHYLY